MPDKITDSRGRLDLTNTQILNTVRKYAPLDYQQRIPVATQGNIQEVLRTMNNYMPNWDVFWNVFIGRIGRVVINDRMNFTNPLAKLKGQTLNYGMSMQEVQANLIKARVYDKNDTNVFGREGREPDIHIAYHTQNRTDKYELNIPMQEVLHGAFIDGGSISAFFNSLMEIPVASANNDEYVLMRDLVKTYDELHGFYNLNVTERPAANAPLEDMIAWGISLVTKVRATYKKMSFFQTKYSPEGREFGLATRSSRIIALIDADTEAALKAAINGYAFNKEDLQLVADDIIVLDEMPIEGCYCLLLDEDWYQCVDTLSPMMLTAPLNPSNMSYNYFYHVWQIMSYSLFLGAAMFSTRPDTSLEALTSTVTGVTLVDAEGETTGVVEPGGTVQLIAKVQGTNEPNQAVRYEIKAYDGGGRGRTLPAECYVDSLGVFHAGNAPQVAKFVIQATSLENPAFSAQYTVTVAGETYVTKIAGTAVAMETGGKGTSTITITPSNATQQAYEAVAVEDAIAISNITETGIEIASVGDAGTYNVVVIAQGGDPTKAAPKATIKVTVTDPTE